MAATTSIAPHQPSTAAGESPITPEVDVFGPPPLINGEDPTTYEAFLRRVSVAVRPRDVIEEILVRDVIDLSWEVLRSRRLKASFSRAAEYKGVEKAIEPLAEYPFSEALSELWAKREPEAIEEVNCLLAKSGLTIDAVAGQTLVLHLDEVERIDRLLATAEARRNNALHEIDRHRASSGATLRTAVEEAEDAEYVDVENGHSSISSTR
jgi:hypothetical protein